MERIVFEDTTVVKKPYIDFNGVEYEVQDGEYQGGTDLNASTFNQLQDNIEEAISESSGYSTTEIKVGVWTDGKPIYRQVFQGNSPTVQSAHSNFETMSKQVGTISNLKKVINVNEHIIPSSGNGAWKGFVTKTVFSGVQIGAAGVVTLFMSEMTDQTTYLVSVDYTKTTD